MLTLWFLLTLSLISQPKRIATETVQEAIEAVTSPTIYNESIISDLESAESKEPNKADIIKQIRHVNNDGSSVVGYEAVDGTFKIESRDVLGNIKGTFGFVDENGEIKRVSYIANNVTNDLKSTPLPTNNGVYMANKTTIQNTASSTAQLTTSHTKRRIFLPSTAQAYRKQQYSSTLPMKKIDQNNKSTKFEPTTTIVYATSIQTTDTPSTILSNSGPFRRLSEVEINDRFSKVLNMNKNIFNDSNYRSNYNDVKTGRRQLRRQLQNDQSENFETSPQVIFGHSSDEEITGTQRPLFTTTNSPRIPAIVIAARNRASILKNMKQPASTTEKFFKQTRKRPNESSWTQSPVAVQIPANRETVQKEKNYMYPISYSSKTSKSSNELDNINGPKQYKLPVQENDLQRDVAADQYIRKTLDSDVKDSTTSTLEQYENNDENAATNPILQPSVPYSQRYRTDVDQRIQQVCNWSYEFDIYFDKFSDSCLKAVQKKYLKRYKKR